jgi:hypothetical protein
MPIFTRQCGFLTNTCGEDFCASKRWWFFTVNFLLINFCPLVPRQLLSLKLGLEDSFSADNRPPTQEKTKLTFKLK